MLRGFLAAVAVSALALAARDLRGQSLSGRVTLDDGTQGAGARVQRVCDSAIMGEAFTDAEGRFVISAAAGPAPTVSMDASVGSNSGNRGRRAANVPAGNGATNNAAAGNGTSNASPSSASGNAGSGNTNTGAPPRIPRGASPAVGNSTCELRVSFGGYQSRVVTLGTDSGSVGSILLHRAGPGPAMTLTATTLLAPKGARHAYADGLEAVRHSQPDRAQNDFLEAVKSYPRFAAAWFELGKVYEQRGHLNQAREAYDHSASADPGYLFPYERLCLLDLKQRRWQEAADASGKVLRLDPYEFPRDFYYNAVSNLELNRLDAAERSARESAKLDRDQAEPRANYVLGMILLRRGDLAGAAESLRTFLGTSYSGAERGSASTALAEIERQSAKAAASNQE